MRASWSVGFFVAAWLGLMGCGGDSGSGADAAILDAAGPDSPTPDATPDATSLDATSLDAIAPDATSLDAMPSADALSPDASSPDAMLSADALPPDAQPTDAPPPDAPPPDAPPPDAPAPDAPAPDAPAPDAPAPDAAPPDAPAQVDASVDGTLIDASAGPDAPASDAAASCTPLTVRVTNAAGSSSEPVLVWDGTGYGVAWTDTRDGNSEVYFARLDASGAKIGSDLRVTSDPATSEGLSLVWTGTEYGISWYDLRDGNYEIYFARIDAFGVKQGGDIRVTNQPARSWGADLAWSGTEYGVAWWENRDGTNEVYFARLDAAGVKIGMDVRVTTGASASSPVIVSTGTEYALAWGDSRNGGSSEIYFTRLDALGTKLGNDVRVTNATGSSDLPSLIWNGTGYGLGWEDSRTGMQTLFFVLLDGVGAKLSAETPLSSRLFTPWKGVWTGTGYGLAWTDSRDGNLEIYFTTLDATGARTRTDLRVTNDPATSRATSLAWTGSEYGLVWGDSRDGNTEVYFARVCP